MRGALPSLPNTTSWRDAQLKNRRDFIVVIIFYQISPSRILLEQKKEISTNQMCRSSGRQMKCIQNFVGETSWECKLGKPRG
jgi:hypothetical protein